MTCELQLNTVEETIRFGRALGAGLERGDLISLVGDFGAGKTTLTRGIALGLWVDPRTRVVSPTFVLLCIHKGRVPLFHYDIQRLPVATELYDLDWDMAVQGVTVVEWGDRVDGFKGCDHLELRLSPGSSEGARTVTGIPHGERFKRLLGKLLQDFPESARKSPTS